MCLQNSVLERYIEVFGKRTYNMMAERTGINITRVFRLFNGSKMKLEEYEMFKNLIDSELGEIGLIGKLAENCFQKLPLKTTEEIKKIMDRKLALWELKSKRINILKDA